MVELIGLSITGLLLFTIACSLQVVLGLLSGGALYAQRGVLAFGFFFYVCAAFVAAGTRQRPDHPHSLLANLCLRAGFLGAGFLLWRHAVPSRWFGLALGLVLLVHGGAYGFALLRRRALSALLRQPAAFEDTFIERFFFLRAPTYHAIPIGGALGTLLGAMITRDQGELLRHAFSGVCGALALAQLPALLTGARTLAGSLTRDQIAAQADSGDPREPALSVRAVDSPRALARGPAHCQPREELRVFAPAHRAGPLAIQIDQVATALRRVLLVNQLQRAALASLAVIVIWSLECAERATSPLVLTLLGGSIALTFLPYTLGQRTR